MKFIKIESNIFFPSQTEIWQQTICSTAVK